MIRILLLSDMAREPERQLLKGLVNYANNHGGCALFPVPPFILKSRNNVDAIIEKARALKVDAIFGNWPDIDTEKAKALGIPVILRTHDKYFPDFPMLTGEHDIIGSRAAEFFINKHFRSLAYFGNNRLWSKERLDGFLSTCSKYKYITASSFLTDDTANDWNAIGRWLKKLPKPVGLVACHDVLGHTICGICQEFGLNIPGDISVLGIDNDEFLCNISSPRMSSMHLEFEKQGEELGRAIIDMVSNGKMKPVRIPVKSSGITERESTLHYNISNNHVQQVVNYIDNHYAEYIELDDILSGIPLSRRAIEINFKKEMAPYTIYSYLNYVRVQHMCTLLKGTDKPIAIVAEQCGFTDIFNVGRIFKRYTGLSPREYRTNQKKK